MAHTAKQLMRSSQEQTVESDQIQQGQRLRGTRALSFDSLTFTACFTASHACLLRLMANEWLTRGAPLPTGDSEADLRSRVNSLTQPKQMRLLQHMANKLIEGQQKVRQ